MHILFVTLEVFGGAKKGGGERYVTELARAAPAHGLTVDVAVVRSMREFAELVDLDAPAHPISPRRFFDLVRRCDIVHVHQLNTPGFDYAALLAKLLRKPLVLTDHGGGALTPGRALGGLRLRLINAAGYVSAWSRQDIDPTGIIKQNMVILGGGDHLPDAEPLEQNYDFGFIGRLVPHKGAHIAIEALPTGRRLILAGQPRDQAYFASLKQLAQNKDVTFVSDAADEIVARLHKSIGFLLVPSVEHYQGRAFSRPELLGLVALEALAAGTPVIGSDVGGLGELLKMAGQITVQPGNVAKWHQALSRAGSSHFPSVSSSAFTWDAVARKCIDLYRSL
ncbi:glycosyltransferase family 4 protein [Rhizobium sp. SG570]|uniref:glycosyltransferase family 4 protein n=1 Tax=Rhizobium sp. SG570 TaxID=2587113 RepID=UPI0014453234|nr:glycosyltransferase family 4 protein [Rhizobium sp. SG570]NKJ40321.1 glycosyltransferase involved in cell wall biosynthesis [Rhizobium sp. SG570]